MEDIKRMVSARGFVEVFWERITADRKAGGKLTFRDCYSQMEVEFEAAYGVSRWPSYDAFRMARERIRKSKRKSEQTFRK